MSPRNKKRIFIIACFVIAIVIMYVFPLNKNEEETTTSETEITSEVEEKDYSGSEYEVFVISPSHFDVNVYFENNESKTYNEIFYEHGYKLELFQHSQIGSSAILNIIKQLDLNDYDTYVINCGFIDYLYNIEIYGSGDDTFAGAVQSIITEIKTENPDAKILLLTDRKIKDDDTINAYGYTYLDYHDTLIHIAEKNDVKVIDVYNANLGEPGYTIKDLLYTVEEQQYICDEIMNYIK